MATGRYELHAFAKGADGSLRPFHLIVLEPVTHDEFGWECGVLCDALRQRPMKTFGDDPDFAQAMAFALVRRLVEYAEWSLVDETGRSIILPQGSEA